jgi:hypothetical protein
VRLAKEAGCMVGRTSNGTLLDRDITAKLINEGLDIIGFPWRALMKKMIESVKAPGLKRF